ncbi:isochorismatase family protein [Mesorhizobium sp. M1C.F.Ca.ET.187.01.1.1]|uniref:cysteine hydrolase family protein n=1 Tax=unclassified Mesorhizobium TaxID=325217 RepID=UPI0032AFB0E5
MAKLFPALGGDDFGEGRQGHRRVSDAFAPPARTFDKTVYSPWFGGQLARTLIREEVDTVIISGGEADMCVLATVMGAIDLGSASCLRRTRSAARPTSLRQHPEAVQRTLFAPRRGRNGRGDPGLVEVNAF